MIDATLQELWAVKDNIAKEHAYDLDNLVHSLFRPTNYKQQGQFYERLPVQNSWMAYTLPMPNYHRYRIPGGCYFFTVNLLERNNTLLVDHIDLLRESIRLCKQKSPFHIDV